MWGLGRGVAEERGAGGSEVGVGRSKTDLGTLAEDDVFDAAVGAPRSLAPRRGAVAGQGQGARLPLVLGEGR